MASMPDIYRDIKVPDSFKSVHVGLFIAGLDDQNRRLFEDIHDITPAELEWQSAPGMNTIGMLLAHIAIVEVWWMHVGPLAAGSVEAASAPLPGILGVGLQDDGMPIEKANGEPPNILAGRDLAFYEDLFQKARNFTKETTVSFTPEDLDRTGSLKRRDGSTGTYTVRWVLYHILEHEAAHYGQIGFIRHLYRDRGRKPA
jgi:uncharacterized damage-inducible protein DinB